MSARHEAVPAERRIRPGIVTVTPNPAWDVTYPVPELRVGESMRVHAPTGRAGGKGINVARVVRDLGGRALIVAPAGGRRGRAFADSLAADDVPARLVPVTSELRQSVAVVPDAAGADAGSPTLFNEVGQPLGPHGWDALTAALEAAVTEARPGVVVVSGSMPPGATEDQLAALVATGRRGGAAVLVDTSGEPMLWAARAGADLLKPNRAEALAAAGASDLEGAVGELRRLGARSVVVTDGREGMRAYDGGGVWSARPRRVTTGNPTGAGDAALAALALTWAESWPHRLESAVAASVAAVRDPVAGRVDPDLVAEAGGSIDIEETSRL